MYGSEFFGPHNPGASMQWIASKIVTKWQHFKVAVGASDEPPVHYDPNIAQLGCSAEDAFDLEIIYRWPSDMMSRLITQPVEKDR